MIGKGCEAGRSGPDGRTMERMLPRDHLLRRVNRMLDLGALRPALDPSVPAPALNTDFGPPVAAGANIAQPASSQ